MAPIYMSTFRTKIVQELGPSGIRLQNLHDCQIVVVVFEDIIYKREFAEDSGYEELGVFPQRLTAEYLQIT